MKHGKTVMIQTTVGISPFSIADFFHSKFTFRKVRKKKYQKVDNMSEELFNPLWNEGLKFIKVIENYIDFFREFEDLFRRLPEGTYERSKIDEITIVTIKR